MLACPTCGTPNEVGRKFCGECGAALAHTCATCGAGNAPGMKFCGECGSPLTAGAGAAAPARTVAAAAPAAERRLVSVLFADLVGFTTLSESRDAEEVRELLSRYFDTCRRLIELYGGTVEKFIGDAVMAVWGTPTATEDDAERAVRAALDLVAAVSALGDEVGAAALHARAGVLTGEAAVTIGAEGQGMVAGDLVNTAARIQSVAEPGTVLVGDATKRASEPTVVYEDAGSHELKGKDEPVALHRAIRVVSGRQGALKSAGLEPPFTGRERELRLVKELFHASAAEQTAHLVSVQGIAGIGKSRLAWEFYKYFDGLVDTVYWHRGRCLAYGEGVTYWALADMVRMRARISEDDGEAEARSKLEATLDEHLLDAEERAFVEPRLATLVGIGDGEVSHDRNDLFAAWRLFFERLADTYPTLLVFEDMQWADTSLLDFVEYLLEWSRSSPLFVVVLARPELLEKRPSWGAGRRSFTSLHLDPLSADAMAALLDGFVPGLPEALREQILARAEGIPLYAVETVRMLLDRGLLVQEGPVYRPTGDIPSLEVPETLHGLVASRLDGLPPEERRLLQDAAVLGKTFTRQALAAITGSDEAATEQLLASLVRKEILGVQADPTSPEHGQYGFLQDLVRHVAYEMLSKRERRSRHITAAAYLESAPGTEEELAEVIASHYLDAYATAPDADDAAEIRARAQGALVRAGERADSLGAAAEAVRYFVLASELTGDALEQSRLLERAGWLNVSVPDWPGAEQRLAEAIALCEAKGETRAAARVSARLAIVESWQGKSDAAIPRAEAAFATLQRFEPGEEMAAVAATLASGYSFIGEPDKAREKAELALELAQAFGTPELLVRAFSAKALATQRTRPHEALALRKHQLSLTREHDLPDLETNALFNLSDLCFQRDRYEEALSYLEDGLAVARRRGSRPGEWSVLGEMTYPLFMQGRWDEALALFDQVPEERLHEGTTESFLSTVTDIHVARGEVERAAHVLSLYAPYETSENRQRRSMYLAGAATVARAEGRLEQAIAHGLEATRLARDVGGNASQAAKLGLVEAIEAALALGERDRADELVASIEAVPPGLRSPYLGAQALRYRGRLAASADLGVEHLEAAAGGFRELRAPFWLAVTLLEQSELTGDESLLEEAREIFDGLRAIPWLERAAGGRGAAVESAPAGASA